MSFINLQGFGAVSGPSTSSMAGITDAMIYETAAGPVLITTTRGDGALVAYQLGAAAGGTGVSDSWQIGSNLLQLESTDLAVAELDGAPTLLMAGLYSTGLFGVTLGTASPSNVLGTVSPHATGAIAARTITDIAMGEGGIHGVASVHGQGLFAITAQSGGGFGFSAIDIAPLSGGHIGEISADTVAGRALAVTTHWSENAISIFEAGAGGYDLLGSLIADGQQGWFSQPMDADLAEVGGMAYAIVAAAGSGSLSVLSIDDEIAVVDHLLDTRDTRFADASVIETVQMGEMTFVIAAGSDNGLTVFALLPGGRLHHVETISGTVQTPLDGITNIAVHAEGGEAWVYATRQGDPYIVVLSLTLPNSGDFEIATATGGVLNGSSGNDILAGLDANDRIIGGAGDDIIVDGAGADTLSGGAGADDFVLVADGARDVIEDFEVGQDRLDLTGFGIQWDQSDLVVRALSWGLELTFGDEVIELHGAGGTTLREQELTPGDFIDLAHLTFTADPLVTGPEILYGGSWADTLQGDAGADEIHGLGGDDVIEGQGGSDTLWGDDGNDRIDGGSGNDLLNGGTGQDTVFGGIGYDSLSGDFGNDSLEGGDGNDSLTGGVGNDILRGGGDNDTLLGEQDHDRLFGEDGRDLLRGEDGNDTLDGGLDADTLYGGSGNDDLLGGDGSDRLFGGDGRDTLEGAYGTDTIYGGEGDDLILAGGSYFRQSDVLYGEAGDDRLLGQLGFDLVWGGEGDDFLDGGLHADTLHGEGGNDTLYGGHGLDQLHGGVGNDFLHGGIWADDLFGGIGNDTLDGGDGHDVLHGEAGDDFLNGAYGSDNVFGETGNDTLYGRLGNDFLHGEDGTDVIYAGYGFDWLYGGDGNDVMYGGGDNDRLFGATGDDRLYGQVGDDRLFGAGGDDIANGGDGNDLVMGGAGQDRLVGERGNDTMGGDAGRDEILGGLGDDSLEGGADNDSIYGGDGNDTMRGDEGNDLLLAGGQDDRVFGGAGDDTIYGQRGDDRLFGSFGNDRIWGDQGNDLIFGEGGDDLMNGGEGFDTFVFADGHGNDTISDFNHLRDQERIDFSGHSAFNSFGDVVASATDTAQGVVIDTGAGSEILLQGLTLTQLDASDFIF